MNEQTPYYIKTIRSEFLSRTERRADYSLRTFARFLGVEAASLSGILKGARRIPKTHVEKFADKLNLSPVEKALFVESNLNKHATSAASASHRSTSFQLSDEAHFKIIAEWEHYAILSLIQTEGFKSSPSWIAKRLGLSAPRVQACLDHLFEVDLIRSKSGVIVARQSQISTTEDVPSKALKKARKQDLVLAQIAIDEVSLELRDLSSCTVSLSTDDLEEMKTFIRSFRKRFIQKAESKIGNEVYKLAVQLFPLTVLEKKNENC